MENVALMSLAGETNVGLVVEGGALAVMLHTEHQVWGKGMTNWGECAGGSEDLMVLKYGTLHVSIKCTSAYALLSLTCPAG